MPKFQFLYGAIKTFICVRDTIIRSSFNSSMVRLKPGTLTLQIGLSPLFQFLYGAIKTFKDVQGNISSKVSIPLWCD